MRKWCHSTGKGYSLVLIHPVPSNFGPLWIFCRLTTVNPNHSIYESCIGYYYCKNCVVRHDSCESITHLTPSCKKFKKDGKNDVRASNLFIYLLLNQNIVATKSYYTSVGNNRIFQHVLVLDLNLQLEVCFTDIYTFQVLVDTKHDVDGGEEKF